MDPYTANDYFEKHANKVLRLDPYVLRKMGLIKNRVVLAMEEFFLNCVPFEISPGGCRAISILSPEEINHFSQFLDKVHKISFVFQNPMFSKEITIPLQVRVLRLTQHNEESRYCIVDMKFVRVSREFKEILVTAMKELDQAQAVYNNPKLGEIQMPGARLKQRYGDDHLTITLNGRKKPGAKAVYLNTRRCRLFCECADMAAEAEEDRLWELDFESGSHAFSAKAKLLEKVPLEEVPEFFFLEFEVEYSPGWVEQVAPLMKKKKK